MYVKEKQMARPVVKRKACTISIKNQLLKGTH